MPKEKLLKKLTVIIPFYNALAYKEIVVNNIKRNNYDFVSFILIDDGSDDNHLNQLKKEITNKSVMFIRNENNYGVSKSRNIGIQECKTEYLLFCDVDDELELGNIKDFKILFDEKMDLQIYAYEHNDKKGFKKKSMNHGFDGVLTGNDIKQLINSYLKYPTGRSILVSCWSRIYKTVFLKNNNILFDESINIFEDSLFNSEVITRASKIKINQVNIYKHWIHGDGMSNYGKTLGKFCDHLKVFYNFQKKQKIKDIDKYINSSVSYYLSRTLVQIKNKSLSNIYMNIDKLLEEKLIINSLKYHRITCIKMPFIKNWMFKSKFFVSLVIFLRNKFSSF